MGEQHWEHWTSDGRLVKLLLIFSAQLQNYQNANNRIVFVR